MLTKIISVQSDWLENLEQFLDEAAPKCGGLTFVEAHGLFAASVTGPEPPPLQRSIAVALGRASKQYPRRVIEDVTNAIIALRVHIVSQLQDRTFTPPGYPDPDQVARWCRGYVRGLVEDPEWSSGEQPGPEWGIMLLSPDLEPLQRRLTDLDGHPIDREARAERLRAELPDRAIAAYEHSRERRERGGERCTLCGDCDHAPPRLAAVRQALCGRNDPCPCGSGIKYKRCCQRLRPMA